MKTLPLILLLLCGSVQAEGLFLSIGAGTNWNGTSIKSEWEDGGGTGAYLSAVYRWDKQAWCFDCYPSINYVHLSQWDIGQPWNDKYEDSVDHFGFGWTWEIWKKD
ncbi:MAG: hypothetical protein ACYSO0_00785 [Planctomycetota bacterium]|jgi:hypothetical protein